MKFSYFVFLLLFKFSVVFTMEYEVINIHFDNTEDQELFIKQAKKLPGTCAAISDDKLIVIFLFNKPRDKNKITQLIQKYITASYKEILFFTPPFTW